MHQKQLVGFFMEVEEKSKEANLVFFHFDTSKRRNQIEKSIPEQALLLIIFHFKGVTYLEILITSILSYSEAT